MIDISIGYTFLIKFTNTNKTVIVQDNEKDLTRLAYTIADHHQRNASSMEFKHIDDKIKVLGLKKFYALTKYCEPLKVALHIVYEPERLK